MARRPGASNVGDETHHVDMIFLHDIRSQMRESTLTERGQISVPAELRKAMRLRPGQRFRWERISEREMRVSLEEDAAPGPLAMLGYARKLRPGRARRTSAWIRELRAGEKAG